MASWWAKALQLVKSTMQEDTRTRKKVTFVTQDIIFGTGFNGRRREKVKLRRLRR